VQGGVLNNNGTVHGTLLTHQPAAADLLATLPTPSAPAAVCPGSACPNGTTLNSGATSRLLPGTYTQPLYVNSGAMVCVAPGVYVLKPAGRSTARRCIPTAAPAARRCPPEPPTPACCSTSPRARDGQRSGDFSQLRAMRSGPYAGLLYWQADAESTMLNGSVGFAGGAWYEPKGALVLNGSTH